MKHISEDHFRASGSPGRGRERVTLLELNLLVREVIECEMPGEYWVEAELSECRESRGHCYMELVQYEDAAGTGAAAPGSPGYPGASGASGISARAIARSAAPLAKASAKCWASKWMVIRPYFERTTGQALHAGMKVLLKVYAQFHEAYGFSWIVTDIDPTYTLGDQARKRQEIIRQLKAEGVFDLQRELRLPRFCQRIAVISSATAAGYGDFCNQLHDNPYGFSFDVTLFPATMQGDGVEQSVIAALEAIYAALSAPPVEYTAVPQQSPFDCVVIIRGGGATADLSGFDTLALAENVANFPIPVITGIGHDRDESILDMVAHLRVKTPTAAAAFLISHLKEVLDVLTDAQARIARSARQTIASHQTRLAALSEMLPRLYATVKARREARLDTIAARLGSLAQQKILNARYSLGNLERQLPALTERRIMAEHHRLAIAEEKAKSLDPALQLRRGYSITLKDGLALRDAAAVSPGDVIETRLATGTLRSTVTDASGT